MYKVILQETLFPSALILCYNPKNWEKAPCYTDGSIKVWMEDRKAKTLSWSIQSLDLKTSENLWNVDSRKLR